MVEIPFCCAAIISGLFGLIAEEVYEEIPELVAVNKDGSPEGVRYDMLSVLLINELKKERQKRMDLENRISRLEQLLGV